MLIVTEICLPFSVAVPEAEAADAWNNVDWPYQTLLTVDHTKVGITGEVATTTYSTAGTYYFSVPEHSSIVVEVWGGGGGGGGATANNGATGGQSSFNGTVLANGGAGGSHGATGGSGGTGGTASGGDTNTTGGSTTSNAGGAGANGGAGGAARGSSGAGNAGTQPGGGGGGAAHAVSCGKDCTETYVARGGGGGGYSKKTYSAGTFNPGSTITVVVGSGGAGGAAGTYKGGDGAVGRVSIAVASLYSNVENFPVYVNLAHMPAEFWNHVRSDCGDIRVLSSNGAPEVPREIVSCDTGTDTGEMWFKAPLLSGSTDMPFYIAYGNASATDYSATETYGRNNVWSNGYAAVWHFQDGTTLSVGDSTSYANDGTNNGATAATGKVDGGASFNGSSSYIRKATFSGTPSSTMTICTWLKTSGTSSYIWQINRNPSNINNEAIFGISTAGKILFWDYSTSLGFSDSTTVSNTAVNDNQWHFGCFVKNGTSGTFYTDGAADGTKTAALNVTYGSADSVIGKNYRDNNQFFNGTLDNLIIASVARTVGWIKTDYNNQNSPGTFYAVAGFTSPPRVVRLLGNVRLRGVRLY